MLLNIGIFWYEVLNKKFILSIIYIIYENIYIKKRILKKYICIKSKDIVLIELIYREEKYLFNLILMFIKLFFCVE